MTHLINKTIIIRATPAVVWAALTNLEIIKLWMAEPEMPFEITADWRPGNPIRIKGCLPIEFENKGTILRVEPEKILQYNFLSSLSQLLDKPENYSIVAFRLEPVQNRTLLTLTVSNFPTETIFKHLEFYWTATLAIMRALIEGWPSDHEPTLF